MSDSSEQLDAGSSQPPLVADNQKQCSAIGLADNKPCGMQATSANGLFCYFHSKQCYGLYKGYKRRNAQLDALAETAPAYLANSRKPLASLDFLDLSDERQLEEIQHHLFHQYTLLDRVIRARKLHHTHFYAQTMDYGHEKYLNSLITQKLTALRALERVVHRRAEVLYHHRSWYSWTREYQQEIDNQRETEQKRVKREAALFRRQAKEIQRRMQELRAKEDAQRQEEYLEQAYQQRLAEESDAESWDPIEDVLENERGTYVDLITHFLWLKDQSPESTIPDSTTLREGTAANKSEKENSQSIHRPGGEEALPVPEKEPSGPQKARKKKKGAKHKKTQEKSNQDSELVAVNSVKETSSPRSRSTPVVTSTPPQRPDKEPDYSQIESREEMRSRLLQGTKIRQVIVMSKEERLERMPPMPAPEVDRLLEEIAEIKSYLFCRLLLGNSVLLPSAMKAANFQELFNDPEVKTQDLRDLCLKLEQPQLQEIRDACADFFRRDGATEEGPEEDSDEGDSSEDDVDDAPVRKRKSKHPLPPVWQSKREKAKKAAGKRPPPEMMEALKHMDATEQEPGSRIDFGAMNDARNIKQTNSRVKICGRYIYNYPSESRLSRGGWLHFNIIAKDCSLFKAVELCKSWDEFYELSLLTVYVYFPSPQWLRWAVGSIRQHYLHAGFVPFYVSDDTSEINV
ncbi:hypothetical protein HRR83_006115 [Exophiala dermatitidis]|uniref:Uncharacterized protein n=2 Tax=Exophiala dermatitidis TaxID=5970 RepID=H6BML7_EXODN|nr:uncharacterized protein HMPREF1120_01245 [Exophiala dermatitidis NIH/UT8656]KAJ4515047.1 hypothetical protein HRR74_005512 [Exophiala dermatitidis]EHY53044.1 hypothetical protein HMPREF1120_01245 [Exophiala dermatitidis NIH/UT8656]KAJ4517538.1 hypothetical protein HRR73_004590 [Exophiala dermatitidis]KAJ4548702.1 hypothetical protein HRR76_001289 [Exophiala dermatitidis]KAJ4552579.1 hypothetical protein HRR77_002581 [Exophiala dermatitidis]